MLKSNTCVAFVQLVPGERQRRRCGVTAVDDFGGDIPVCDSHLEIIRKRMASCSPPARIVEVHTAGTAVVYYIGDPESQRVKIGTSTRFRERFVAIRGRVPKAVLLAVEPGGFDLEKVRHAQFDYLRVKERGTQREWFRKTSELMLHVNLIRNLHGDPLTYQPGGKLINSA